MLEMNITTGNSPSLLFFRSSSPFTANISSNNILLTPIAEQAMDDSIMSCPEPGRHGTPFETIAYGFIYPVLALVVIFTNCNGVAVILKMANFTQTNILLLSIFIADILTTVLPLPRFLYTFSINWNEPIMLHYPWCFLIYLSTPVMPTITNNISIWLVALLSVQRCLCVRNRDIYERFFSQRRIILAIILICALTSVFHTVLFVNNFRFSAPCFLNETDYDDPTPPETNIITVCDDTIHIIPEDTMIQNVIMYTYYPMRVVVFHILPIIAIAASTALLIFVLFQAQSRIERLSKHAQTSPTADETQAESIKDQLDRIEENEYRNATVNLSERRRRSMANYIRRPNSKFGLGKERRSLIRPSVRKTLASTAVNNNNANLNNNSNNNSNNLGNKNATHQKQKRVSTTTHMLVIISTIYLIQHIFHTVLFVTAITLILGGIGHRESTKRALRISTTIGNLCYVAGFPAAFLLCVAVQEPFREMFYSIYEDNSLANWLQRRKQSASDQMVTTAGSQMLKTPATTSTPLPASQVPASSPPPPTSKTNENNNNNNNNNNDSKKKDAEVPLIPPSVNEQKPAKAEDEYEVVYHV